MKSRALLLAVFAVLIAAAGVSPLAAAHAQYVASNPTANADLPSAPTQVSITLSEAIQSGTGTIAVTNANGTRFDRPPVNYSADRRTMSVSLAPSSRGIYTVSWTAVSAVDGHPTAGAFAYAVDPDGSLYKDLPKSGASSTGSPISPLEVALRFIGFLGIAVVLGVCVMAAFMWLSAGRDPDIAALRAYGVGFPVLMNVGRIAAFAFAAAMAGLLGLATSLEGTTAAAALSNSPYVQTLAVQLSLGAVAFVLLSRAFGHSRVSSPDKVGRTVQAALILALAAIVIGSLGTHAAAAAVPGELLPPLDVLLVPLAIASDAAHLVGVGLWVGGLAGVFAVRALFRESEAAPLARIVLTRFSRLAAYAVGLVLGGGLVLSIVLVGSVGSLVQTAYGWVVLGKVALFAPMLATGAYNRFRLIPEVAEPTRAPDAVRHLVRNMRFETVLGIAVLALAGLLTTMSPAVTVASPFQIFSLSAPAEDLRVDLQVYPYPTVPGLYTFTVLLYNRTTGAAYDAVAHNTTGRITFVLENSTLAPETANLSGPHSPNHFFVVLTLSQPGLWRLDVTFSRKDAFDVRAEFHVPIQPGG
jgi:copper transport protein